MARETTRDRRERVAAMQAQAKRAERRRLLLVVGAVVVVLAVIGGAVAWAIVGEQSKKAAAVEGMTGDVAAAACDPVIDDPASGSADHVGPGTSAPDKVRIDYATAPPSSGQHLAQPALSDRRVYTVADAPAIESLVHNLEHGYTILWYDPSARGEPGLPVRGPRRARQRHEGSREQVHHHAVGHLARRVPGGQEVRAVPLVRRRQPADRPDR